MMSSGGHSVPQMSMDKSRAVPTSQAPANQQRTLEKDIKRNGESTHGQDARREEEKKRKREQRDKDKAEEGREKRKREEFEKIEAKKQKTKKHPEDASGKQQGEPAKVNNKKRLPEENDKEAGKKKEEREKQHKSAMKAKEEKIEKEKESKQEKMEKREKHKKAKKNEDGTKNGKETEMEQDKSKENGKEKTADMEKKKEIGARDIKPMPSKEAQKPESKLEKQNKSGDNKSSEGHQKQHDGRADQSSQSGQTSHHMTGSKESRSHDEDESANNVAKCSMRNFTPAYEGSSYSLYAAAAHVTVAVTHVAAGLSNADVDPSVGGALMSTAKTAANQSNGTVEERQRIVNQILADKGLPRSGAEGTNEDEDGDHFAMEAIDSSLHQVPYTCI